MFTGFVLTIAIVMGVACAVSAPRLAEKALPDPVSYWTRAKEICANRTMRSAFFQLNGKGCPTGPDAVCLDMFCPIWSKCRNEKCNNTMEVRAINQDCDRWMQTRDESDLEGVRDLVRGCTEHHSLWYYVPENIGEVLEKVIATTLDVTERVVEPVFTHRFKAVWDEFRFEIKLIGSIIIAMVALVIIIIAIFCFSKRARSVMSLIRLRRKIQNIRSKPSEFVGKLQFDDQGPFIVHNEVKVRGSGIYAPLPTTIKVNGEVPETILAAATLTPIDALPKFVGFFLVGDTPTVVGMFSRVLYKQHNCILTAFHVLHEHRLRDLRVGVWKDGEFVTLPVDHTWKLVVVSEQADLVIMMPPQHLFSVLGLKLGVVDEHPKKHITVYLHGLHEGRPHISYGKLNIREQFKCEYGASTKSGWSGAPILNARNQIIGVHTTGSDKVNSGSLVFYLFRRNLETDYVEEEYKQGRELEDNSWALKFISYEEKKNLDVFVKEDERTWEIRRGKDLEYQHGTNWGDWMDDLDDYVTKRRAEDDSDSELSGYEKGNRDAKLANKLLRKQQNLHDREDDMHNATFIGRLHKETKETCPKCNNVLDEAGSCNNCKVCDKALSTLSTILSRNTCEICNVETDNEKCTKCASDGLTKCTICGDIVSYDCDGKCDDCTVVLARLKAKRTRKLQAKLNAEVGESKGVDVASRERNETLYACKRCGSLNGGNCCTECDGDARRIPKEVEKAIASEFATAALQTVMSEWNLPKTAQDALRDKLRKLGSDFVMTKTSLNSETPSKPGVVNIGLGAKAVPAVKQARPASSSKTQKPKSPPNSAKSQATSQVSTISSGHVVASVLNTIPSTSKTTTAPPGTTNQPSRAQRRAAKRLVDTSATSSAKTSNQ
jgi:hypothetical protein